MSAAERASGSSSAEQASECNASEHEWRGEWPITLRVDFIVILPIVWLKRVRGAVMTTDSEKNAHIRTRSHTHM